MYLLKQYTINNPKFPKFENNLNKLLSKTSLLFERYSRVHDNEHVLCHISVHKIVNFLYNVRKSITCLGYYFDLKMLSKKNVI